MLIQELVLRNFRIYGGEHRFDLAPRKRYGKTRPIILFGGLNGAGKTSLLTGLRLALYGRAAVTDASSQKDYEAFLKKSIHRSKATDRSATEASTELSFTYAKLGIESSFRVVRSWQQSGKSVKEDLKIFEDGEAIKGLTYEQAQNFLNELIPIGVSALFFFDGEKIKELADDTGGAALEQSIKKLLGLDIIERLSGDLTVLNRNIAKTSAHDEIEEQIALETAALHTHRANIEKLRADMATQMAVKAEASLRLTQLKRIFDERGGHFSISRKGIEKQIDGASSEKDELVAEISILLGDASPLALSGEFAQRVLDQINQDLSGSNVKRPSDIKKALTSALTKNFKKDLSKDILKDISDLLGKTLEHLSENGSTVIHDLTPSQAGAIISAFAKANEQQALIKSLFVRLEKAEYTLDELGSALARAPDDELIQKDFERLQITQSEVATIDAKIQQLRNSATEEAGRAVDCARKLDKLYEKAAKSSDQGRVLGYIGATNDLLADFVDHSAKAKIKDLEHQFTHCFSSLARKNDLKLQIRVDPQSFKFHLLTENGDIVDKDDLSAGEKQIFAISVLEALAKTSGRQLPMIVDTPLGRLDSQHRAKLIEGYFPRASHQMIILSTDTEVDEEFYQALSPEISRAYRLEYNPKNGSTEAAEGYFWQQRKAV